MPAAQANVTGSNVHFLGSSTTPSMTPSFASHVASVAACTAASLLCAHVRAGRLEQRLLVPHEAGEKMRPVVCRRTHQHAVVVARKTLYLHQCLTSAVRARAEIRMLDLSTVKCPDDVFGTRSLKMLTAPAKIDDLLRMARREVGGAADVTRIRGAAGVAAPKGVCDAAVVDCSSIAALTC